MKILKALTVLLLIILFRPYKGECLAEQMTTLIASPCENTEIEFDLSYEIIPKPKSDLRNMLGIFQNNEPSDVNLIVNLPRTIEGRQDIIEVRCNPDPPVHFEENGNIYVGYVFPAPKKAIKINIHVKANVFRYDFDTALKKGKRVPVTDPNLKRFLCHERMIEKDDLTIQEIARTIRGQNDIETVKNVYEYVIKNLNIDVSKLKGVGAAKTARTKTGMCIDYCDLFVALCRAKHIPAKVVAGYGAYFNVTPKHSWVEVFFEEYGWIPLDPTQWPNMDKRDLNRTFYHLEPQYLSFTNTRNDNVLHNDYFYSYNYRDENVSKAIDVVESIEFVKPLHKTHNSNQDIERTKSN